MLALLRWLGTRAEKHFNRFIAHNTRGPTRADTDPDTNANPSLSIRNLCFDRAASTISKYRYVH